MKASKNTGTKNIIWLLKNSSARVSINNDKWIYWDETTNEWVVMEHGYRRKRSSEIIRTNSEEMAIKSLD